MPRLRRKAAKSKSSPGSPSSGSGPKPGVPGVPAFASEGRTPVRADRATPGLDVLVVDARPLASSTKPRSRKRTPGSAAGHSPVRASTWRPAAGPESILIEADEVKRPRRGRSSNVASASTTDPGGAAFAGRSIAATRRTPTVVEQITSASAQAAPPPPKLGDPTAAATPAATSAGAQLAGA